MRKLADPHNFSAPKELITHLEKNEINKKLSHITDYQLFSEKIIELKSNNEIFRDTILYIYKMAFAYKNEELLRISKDFGVMDQIAGNAEWFAYLLNYISYGDSCLFGDSLSQAGAEISAEDILLVARDIIAYDDEMLIDDEDEYPYDKDTHTRIKIWVDTAKRVGCSDNDMITSFLNASSERSYDLYYIGNFAETFDELIPNAIIDNDSLGIAMDKIQEYPKSLLRSKIIRNSVSAYIKISL